MFNNRLLSEIFDEFKSKSTKEERIQVLRKYGSSKRFVEFLRLMFAENDFDVKVETYKPSKLPPGLNDTYISYEMPKFYRFKRGSKLSQDKKEKLFLDILEGLEAGEAEILFKLSRGELKIPYLTRALAEEALG